MRALPAPQRAFPRFTPALYALAALLVVAAAGCSRPRHGAAPSAPSPASEPAQADGASGAARPTSAPTDVAALWIDEPVADAAVASPVHVKGVIRRQAGRVYVAQVVVAGARPELRGNTRIDVDPTTGAFALDVPYTLDAAAAGTIEIAVVDPVSGTVADTATVPVRLAAAR
ncbi:MAG: hypothetical protein ABI780_09235 [Ardenticatenales bacterium]